ncbi:hypothetical protein D3C85_501130 [compost metagenome]
MDYEVKFTKYISKCLMKMSPLAQTAPKFREASFMSAAADIKDTVDGWISF